MGKTTNTNTSSVRKGLQSDHWLWQFFIVEVGLNSVS